MKPAQFRYHDPETLDETVSLLAEYGEESKLLTGGQSLVPLMNFRLARPRNLIDINRVATLDYLREEDHTLVIGALTRQRSVERSKLIESRNPLLTEASQYIGHPAIRNRGTVCGSLAHADPAAEWPALALATNASLVIRGRGGERRVAAQDFFATYFTTCMLPQEILIEVRVPHLPSGAGWSFLEISRRFGDFALAGVALWLTQDSSGKCTDCSIALTGVGATPVKALAAEERLRGERLSDAIFQVAADAVPGELEPDSDIHASADYRRRVAGVLVRRALAIAHKRARRS